ncbi:GNAT family N-acetyltransferase [Bacillus marinisedimentorum]|uniref:GNAT family N-acetyltransferase n=1 Tax=Bacillus marinisedimentorum TaxID=1821260 RepID=UPI000872A443|nr:GNAT family protein [Bacillus marinisedimentorum]
MNIKLETERLLLRIFTRDDAFRIKELANNKQLAEILGLPHPYEAEHAEDWIAAQPESIKKGIEYPLAIVSKDQNAIIGTIAIRVDKRNNKGELGYWVGTGYWGNGFATEAVNRIIKFGFEELNLNKISASALSWNHASATVLDKAGLQKEGILRQDRLLLDTYEDMVVYGLLRNEYKSRFSI